MTSSSFPLYPSLQPTCAVELESVPFSRIEPADTMKNETWTLLFFVFKLGYYE